MGRKTRCRRSTENGRTQAVLCLGGPVSPERQEMSLLVCLIALPL